MRVEDIQPLCLKVSYLLREEMSLLGPNLLIFGSVMNCSSVICAFELELVLDFF